MSRQYVVKELQTREEMNAVVDVIWKAQYSPYMPSASMFFPVFGYTKEDRDIGIASSKDRLWNEHASHPSFSHWVFVEDTITAQIVAGALWEWHEGGISTNGIAKVDMYWWPEGEAKAFCEEMIRQTLAPRALWMQRPHAGLSMMVVLPEHRNRGVGGLMMAWANHKIDAMGIEGLIEASELGKGLYEKWGYEVVMKLDFFLPPNKGDEWKKWAHEMMMPPWYAMWRPAGGIVRVGERNKPWQLVSQLLP